MTPFLVWLGVLLVIGLVAWTVRRRREREFLEAESWERFVSAFGERDPESAP